MTIVASAREPNTPSWLDRQPVSVPTTLLTAVAPAREFLYEFQDYWLRWPGVDELLCGTQSLRPIVADTFRIRFENQLGLVRLQPLRGGRACAKPICVEVITPKLGTPETLVAFSRALLDDLFAHCTRLPFALGGVSTRPVAESLRVPAPLFVFHFLLEFRAEIESALSTIHGSPFSVLTDRRELVTLREVTYADDEVLLDVLINGDRWRRSATSVIPGMQGHTPVSVLQRIPELSLDTPENRFVRGFVSDLATNAAQLHREAWWKNVPDSRKAAIDATTKMLERFDRNPLMRDVCGTSTFPASSRVLQRREGYRQLTQLWRTFQRARRAVFDALDRAIELRTIDVLYQMWVFFELVEEITNIVGQGAVISLPLSDTAGLGQRARARFPNHGVLVYDEWARGYSIGLRPDFFWKSLSGDCVILDAKFRVAEDESAKVDDLTKMHAYRDALGVRAAVCVFPGTTSEFFCSDGRKVERTLEQVLFERETGIGSISRTPMTELS